MGVLDGAFDVADGGFHHKSGELSEPGSRPEHVTVSTTESEKYRFSIRTLMIAHRYESYRPLNGEVQPSKQGPSRVTTIRLIRNEIAFFE